MEQINVIILLGQIETFQGLKNLYNYLKNIPIFNVKILVYDMTESTRQRWIHNVHCSNLLLEQNIDFITYTDGDLKYLDPDYIFYQTPYMNHYPPELHVNNIKQYSKTCYFGYGVTIWSTNLALDLYFSFLESVDFHIVDNDYYYNDLFSYYEKKMKTKPNHFIPRTFILGNPKVSEIKKSSYIKYENFGWTPRWVPFQSNFEVYFQFFTNYFKNNTNLSLECRFHPLDTNKSRNVFVENIDAIENINITTELLYDNFFEKIDVLISDLSSMIAEFYPTGKPIILTYKDTHVVDTCGKELLRGIYIVHNEKELVEIITQLKNKNDPLYNTRQEIIKKIYDSYSPLEDISKLLLWDYKLNYMQKVKKLEEPKKEEPKKEEPKKEEPKKEEPKKEE